MSQKTIFMNDDLTPLEQSEDPQSSQEKSGTEKVRVSIDLDSEVLDRIRHLTNNPSHVIEKAIKQWLKGDRNEDTDLTRTFQRNPPVPPQGEWND